MSDLLEVAEVTVLLGAIGAVATVFLGWWFFAFLLGAVTFQQAVLCGLFMATIGAWLP